MTEKEAQDFSRGKKVTWKRMQPSAGGLQGNPVGCAEEQGEMGCVCGCRPLEVGGGVVLEATLGSLNLTLTTGSHGESQRRGPASHVLASSDSRLLTNPHPTSTLPFSPFWPSRHKCRVGRGQGQAFPLSSPMGECREAGTGIQTSGSVPALITLPHCVTPGPSPSGLNFVFWS